MATRGKTSARAAIAAAAAAIGFSAYSHLSSGPPDRLARWQDKWDNRTTAWHLAEQHPLLLKYHTQAPMGYPTLTLTPARARPITLRSLSLTPTLSLSLSLTQTSFWSDSRTSRPHRRSPACSSRSVGAASTWRTSRCAATRCMVSRASRSLSTSCLARSGRRESHCPALRTTAGRRLQRA